MREQQQAVADINVSALLCLVVMCILVFLLPRRLAVGPLLLTTFLVTLEQQFVIVGCHFPFYRIVLIFGWVRILLRKETTPPPLGPIDRVFTWWVVVSFASGFLLDPGKSAFVNRGGFAYTALGAYFLVRWFVRDTEELSHIVRALIVICAVLSVFMVYEKLTSRNLFSVFGGVSSITSERDGRVRCQGPFAHPILAGTFGATLLPLCVGLFVYDRKRPLFPAIGVIGSTVMALTAASSGALMAWLYGIVALSLWPWRSHMRLIRWGVLVLVIGLQLVMKAPIWFLIDRLSSLTGGTGYHRSWIIDQAIKHFDEWFLVGTTHTAHWSPTGYGLPNDPNMADITNQFVAEGVEGGLLKLLLFVAIIWRCYGLIGSVVGDPGRQTSGRRFMFWAMGCSLLAHLVSFISVAYFDQIVVYYYTLIALIACGAGPELLQTDDNAPLAEALPSASWDLPSRDETSADGLPHQVAWGGAKSGRTKLDDGSIAGAISRRSGMPDLS